MREAARCRGLLWCDFFILAVESCQEKYAMTILPCEKRTVGLPPEQGRFIDALVDSGAYASASEVA